MSITFTEYLQQEYNDLTNYKGSGLPKFQKFRHRIYPGDFHDTPVTIIETEEELKTIIESKYSHSINLTDIIRLYGEHNIKFTSDVIIQLPINEVNNVCEYNRDIHIYSSKRTPEQYNTLMEDIKLNGFKKCGRIRLTRTEDYQVAVILGEGNHRLSIAKKLKLETMPIRIVYTS